MVIEDGRGHAHQDGNADVISRPHLLPMKMQVDTVMRELERAWSHALPGHEAAERDSVLRELQRLLQQQPSAQALPRTAFEYGPRGLSYDEAGRGQR
jgi:hypothetical protein